MAVTSALTEAVRTTGINWESVGVIVSLVGVLVGAILWWLTRRDQRLRNAAELRDQQQRAENLAIKQEISSAVGQLSEVLLAKLETKDTVSRISERLARVEASIGVKSQLPEGRPRPKGKVGRGLRCARPGVIHLHRHSCGWAGGCCNRRER
jgi:hypothetical protein